MSAPKRMLAITVQQPWAWAIIHGGKNVENRTRPGTWRRAVGQRIAVHAGQRWSERGGRIVPGIAGMWQQGWFDHVDRVPPGVIVGTVLVLDSHMEEGGCCAPWGEASYVEHGGGRRVDIVHLELAEPTAVEPIECRGALGLWTVPEHIEAELAVPHA